MAARLMAVWRAAQKRTEQQQVREAEQRVSDLPRAVPRPQHTEMRRAYASIHGELSKTLMPAAIYVESKVSQLEDGELCAEPLADVLAAKE
eukprot:10853207-Alexandrium_andersonii.AAC.1